MQLPEYITRDEVKRVCSEIGLRDWSKITEPLVSQEEAAMILKIVNTKLMDIPLESRERAVAPGDRTLDFDRENAARAIEGRDRGSETWLSIRKSFCS